VQSGAGRGYIFSREELRVVALKKVCEGRREGMWSREQGGKCWREK